MNEAERKVRELYGQLISAWNCADAATFASLFTIDGNIVGFDGTVVQGQEQIAKHLGSIFAHHKVPGYVSIIKEVRFLNKQTAILGAQVGMVPNGQSDIKPELNAVQSAVAIEENNQWFLALFQNTPAAYHGRPELSDALCAELRGQLNPN